MTRNHCDCQRCAFVLAMLISCMGATKAIVTAQEVPKSSVVFLVDMSASFAPLTSEDSVALESAAEAAAVMTHEQQAQWEQPVRFMWGLIGVSSAGLPAPCGPAVMFRNMIVPRDRPGEIHSIANLRAWNRACILRFMKGVPAQSATDISGAIALAGEVARLVRGLKVLVIVSDFREEEPTGYPAATLRLTAERVVLLYRPVRGAPEPSDDVYNRLQEWEKRLKAAGASTVCRIPIKGILPESVRSCFS